MRGLVRFASIALALFVLAPAAVYAQASIAGVVKDTSGAVLPGVTIEASSDVLIEKTRSAVTDWGRPIQDHRPAAWNLHGDFHLDRFQHREA